jgi:hypothetical protein
VLVMRSDANSGPPEFYRALTSHGKEGLKERKNNNNSNTAPQPDTCKGMSLGELHPGPTPHSRFRVDV